MKRRWFHGDTSHRSGFRGQSWDRNLATSSANENGPGIYFTSSLEEAATYGEYLYEAELKGSFHLMPNRKPTMAFLMSLYRAANSYDKQRFLDDWGVADPKIPLKKYLNQNSLHDAAVSLYRDLIQSSDEWVEAVTGAGYDGVIVQREGRTHLIVWSPEALIISEV